MLAGGAIHRGAAGDGGLFQRMTAGGAGVPGRFAVDQVIELIGSEITAAIHKIAERGSARIDGCSQDGMCMSCQNLGLRFCNPIRSAFWGELGEVQDFIDVDVAEPGNEGLIEQRGFELAAGTFEAGIDFGGCDGQGIRAERRPAASKEGI